MEGPKRSGRVALIGRPNVGKSTLLNAALEQQLTIVSPTPQTTRDAILGVVRRGMAEIALMDTPGLHRARTELGRVMNATAREAARNADVVVFVIDVPKLTKPGDRLAFIQAEFHAAGSEVTAGACKAVLDAVGADLRELAAACSQLSADTPGTVDEDVVGRYFRGRADASGFIVADRAIEGDTAGALAELRMAAAAGVPAVLVVSALSAQIRTIARVASAGRMSADTIARDLKMPPWRVDKARRQSRGWTPESLIEAHTAIARADAEVKGGGTDAGYALERAVMAVARGKGN